MPAGTVIDLGASGQGAHGRPHRSEGVHDVRIWRARLVGTGHLCSGTPPPDGFCIGVADVNGAAKASETVAIYSGGLAISGVMSRWWRLGHDVVHHILDPSTGLPPVRPRARLVDLDSHIVRVAGRPGRVQATERVDCG
jgi:thiamine biosynthesis lipoprotein